MAWVSTGAAVWAAVWWAVVGGGEAYSSLSVAVACDTMLPGHLSLGPQSSSAPYGIYITPRNSSYYVTVYGHNQQEFKGFLLQAKDEQGQRAGHFTKVQIPGRIISCTFDGGAVQHKGGDPKTQITVQWEPRDYRGHVQFGATIVQSYSTYWTNVLSDVLTVL
ncbi:putative defense protein 3 [Homarus americanus]|uniref:putative defense protein 3 n=1 Tax=Homarus americanus TaxID=6706 RepID=UPI001C445250|nr:putative defense protein 3 [Homarus americanus]